MVRTVPGIRTLSTPLSWKHSALISVSPLGRATLRRLAQPRKAR